MDFLKDFDCRIYYHQGKENVVVDALNCKSTRMLNHLMVTEWELWGTMQRVEI